MPKTINKFSISLEADISSSVLMPIGAEVVHVAGQENKRAVSIWYLCDPDQAQSMREFVLVLTGEEAPEDGDYRGTAILFEGAFVVHVFERYQPKMIYLASPEQELMKTTSTPRKQRVEDSLLDLMVNNAIGAMRN